MRKLIIAVLVLGLLAVAADRAAWYVAERRVASVVQQAEGLAQRPDVSIHGVPFLTQVSAGVYDRVDVSATGVDKSGWRFDRVAATLRRAHVPFSELLHGGVHSVPVDSVTARVRVSFAELQRHLERQVQLSYAGGAIRMATTLRAAGHAVQVTAAARLRLDGDTLALTPQSVSASGGGALSRAVEELAARALDLRLPLPDLPYGARVTSVAVSPAGVTLTAAASDVVLKR